MGIQGTWYNELNSMMKISGSGANISGVYSSAVGVSGFYELRGRIDQHPSSTGSGAASATGWTVVWSNSSHDFGSATSWTGLYFNPSAGTEEIFTLWLLATEVEEGNQWGSTKVGQDTFTRVQQDPATVQKRLGRGNIPHPTPPAKK